jgi:hypothetical protein
VKEKHEVLRKRGGWGEHMEARREVLRNARERRFSDFVDAKFSMHCAYGQDYHVVGQAQGI